VLLHRLDDLKRIWPRPPAAPGGGKRQGGDQVRRGASGRAPDLYGITVMGAEPHPNCGVRLDSKSAVRGGATSSIRALSKSGAFVI
jgi:hypothetical protein